VAGLAALPAVANDFGLTEEAAAAILADLSARTVSFAQEARTGP
jgi:hypothetical protein